MSRHPKLADPPDPISDATLRGFSGYVMKRAFNAIQADVNAALAPHDLRMLTFSALSVIVDNPGLRQAQLADALSIERPNLVIVVDDLECRALISRNPAPGDRRAYALLATLKGVRLYEKALTSVQAHEARVTSRLSREERKSLLDMLSKIERGGVR